MAAMVHTPASLVHGPSGPTLAVRASVRLGAMLAGTGTVQVLALHSSRPARHQQPRTANIA